ncbi:MAG: three-Cys-motif partner protein TcmP [Bacteroidetes bacterium]|nr:three-Cys-motif partner protein TcmP [Bacteroidota bacterium]
MKKFHNVPYSEETLIKLGIFRDYLRSWLPVFLSGKEIYWNKINIVDFFAGQGSDVNNVSGSPLIIFEELAPYLEVIKQKHIKVSIILNEKDEELYELLNQNIKRYRNNSGFEIVTKNQDFHKSFSEYYNLFAHPNSANLLFLDQFGIKEIDQVTFNHLIKLRHTDFLFFISSSIVNRFVEEDSINKHIPVNKSDIGSLGYNYIHRVVYNSYKRQLSKSAYYLAPFSIKKGANIYGLIFGSHHPLGMEKFLNTAWKYDKLRGEANFDITKENIQSEQLDLFTGMPKKAKKVELFEKNLEAKILSGEIKTNRDIYLYTLKSGLILKRARIVLRELYKEKKIQNEHFTLTHKCCLKSAVLEKISLI